MAGWADNASVMALSMSRSRGALGGLLKAGLCQASANGPDIVASSTQLALCCRVDGYISKPEYLKVVRPVVANNRRLRKKRTDSTRKRDW
jgi:hypothetical protein